jgi:hypothetical protein
VLEDWAGKHPECRVRVLKWSVRAEPARSPAGLDPDRPSPLYGSALFHGGRFRRVGRYDLLTAFRISAWIRADADCP